MSQNRSIGQQDLKWRVDDIEMEGTVTYPSDSKSSGCIILVAGSGPTDRDWCSPLLPGSNGSGKLIAEELSSHGYVCMRFDKRASGPKVRENFPLFIGKVSMQFHVDELVGAIHAVKDGGFLTGALFALTSSEGAIHALNYQMSGLKPNFSGMILTGVPGRSIADVARQQVTLMARQDKDPESILQLYDDAMTRFSEGKEVNADPSLPENVALLVKSLSSPANLPFSRELWSTDPAKLVSRIEVPVMLMIGKKDLQVDWEIDGPKLEEAVTAKSNFEFYYPENANHVLKQETKPKGELTPQYVGTSYNSPESVLDPVAVSDICDWLDLHSHNS